MKTKITLVSVAVILLIVVWHLGQTSPEKSKTASQQASLGSIKCTVAKFLLSDVDTTQQIAPRFENLGDHHFAISTENKEVQAFFDQGLRLTYAFNHAEAHRSFMEASRLDPSAGMAYWGQAYALGPNINDPLPDDERKVKAFEALQKARENITKASPVEKALIEALNFRYSEDLTTEITELNTAYMNAMAKVATQFPEDADVQTLYAASVMNTMPWNYWDNQGNPAPNTLKGKAALEKAIEINPDHPGAHHYYIHMVELPKPDLAVPSADRLGSLMPAAGHLVHMPSHIYIRVGRYQDAVKANQDAILADEDYISQCYAQGMYPLAYYPHNIHFLWSAASLLGDSKTAIDAARKTAEKVPVGEMANLPFLEDFASVPLLAYARFGKWNEILTVPYQGDAYKHLKLIRHYARGLAFVRKNNLKEAKEELEALEQMKADPALEELVANYTNPSSKIAQVAFEVLAGEVAAADGDITKAINYFKSAVELEDQLIYSEPSAWHIPPRQNLGALLLDSGQYAEAEMVYRKDLEDLRQNGWSLMGLHQSLKAQGKEAEAQKVKHELDRAWEHADITLERSVL
jgi:tetratricopeptide (TPR) repeat protein